MYDRYKTRKKNVRIFRVLVFLAVISGVIFLGFRYQRYLMFWKYNYNKLYKKIEAVRQERNSPEKREALSGLADILEKYKEDHQTEPLAFYMSGEVHYLLGESYLPAGFSELCINDRLHDANSSAKSAFLKAIKDIKKGSALDNKAPDDTHSTILAKASLYADYNTPAEIFTIIQTIGDLKNIGDVEDIRFYSYISIINKREDYGLKVLSHYGMIADSIQGFLFYATAERIAKRYTGAIVSYKNVLDRTSDQKIQKLVHVNLGKIYFNQSLFRESLEHFNLALKIDDKDTLSKIWIGKNYFAMGEKNKARAIWSEVLNTDQANSEARELLKTM